MAGEIARRFESIHSGVRIDVQTGGTSRGISIILHASNRVATLSKQLFLHYLGLKNSQIKSHVIIGGNAQGIKTVAGNPNTIGYVSIGAAEYEVKRGASIKLLPLDGVDATIANVRDGTFPLSRPLNLVTSVEPQG